MLANPAEYHSTMYEWFFNGNAPKERKGPDGKKSRASAVPEANMREFEEQIAASNTEEKRAQRRAAALAKAEREGWIAKPEESP
jgi:hypothetical protein